MSRLQVESCQLQDPLLNEMSGTPCHQSEGGFCQPCDNVLKSWFGVTLGLRGKQKRSLPTHFIFLFQGCNPVLTWFTGRHNFI